MTANQLPKIRAFRAEDIDDILELESQASPKTAYPKAILLNCAARFPDTFVVVESDAHIVGYVIFDLSGHIYSMAVKPSYRRKGFGKMLFSHALTHAGRRLWLEVRSKNTGAIDFYKKMGMSVIGKVSNYYKDDDALVMYLI